MFLVELKIWLLVLSGMFIASMLMFLPLPGWIGWICPQWPTLVMLYFALLMPQRMNMWMACFIGFLFDILYNVPIGENAIALVLVTYLIARLRINVRRLAFWKKLAVIFCLILLCQLVPFSMQLYLGSGNRFWPILTRAIIGALGLSSIVNRRKLYFESYY